jgi:protein-disulfide isomerase
MANRRPADSGAKGANSTFATRAERRAATRRDTRARSAPASENRLLQLGRRWLMPVTLVAALAAAVWIVMAGVTSPATPAANVVSPTEGSATAPVTVAEYSDYQCDYCGRWAREVEDGFRSAFVATGQVRFVWHDMAWEGQESIDAANAARCAGDEGKFWEMHDLLYRAQGATPNTGAFTKDKLKALGATLGLDGKFSACVDAGAYILAVRADSAASSNAGFSGTPAFTVNGRAYVGYQTLDQLTAAVTAAGATAGASASAQPAASAGATTGGDPSAGASTAP